MENYSNNNRITNILLKNTNRGFFKKAESIYLRNDIPCSILDCSKCDNSNIRAKISGNKVVKIIDADCILNNLEAFEIFTTFENSILFMSEYLYIKSFGVEIFTRIKKLIDNKNIYIFPNYYHIDCYPDNSKELSALEKRIVMFKKSCEFYNNHINENANELIKNNMDIEYNIDIVIVSYNKNFNSNNIKTINMIDAGKIHFTSDKSDKDHMQQFENYLNFISCKDTYEIDYKLAMCNDLNHTQYESLDVLNEKVKKGILFKGVINISSLDYGIVKTNFFNKDILIEKVNLNRAMHGDLVIFEILSSTAFKEPNLHKNNNIDNEELNKDQPDINIYNELKELNADINQYSNLITKQNILKAVNQTKMQPTARVVGISKRTKTSLCGTIINKEDIGKSVKISKELEFLINLKFNNNEDITTYNNNNINNFNSNKLSFNELQIFLPIDEKYPPFAIRLYNKEIYYNKRIIIKFDFWPTKFPIPIGHFIKELGDVNDIKVENEVILYEHNININPFSKKIINSLPNEDAELIVEEKELKYRKDLRSLNVCSIDPPGCKDIDDALHSRILSNGNIEVGVHIADVTHYIKSGSEIDNIASKTCNTVYMVHKRTDMLPKVLTENLCSLVAKPRYAFSVLWEFDKVNLNKIVNVEYTKSIIHSKASLTYEEAYNIIKDDKNKSELAKSIRNLNKISKILKNNRIKEGALVLASNEMKFNVDYETNSINDIRSYATFETNSLVEEFMLLANVYVAEKIYESFPSCAVLRRHPPPKNELLNKLSTLLEKEKNLKINFDTNKSLADSLDNIEFKLLEKDNSKTNKFFNKLVRMMTTRTMNQAKYFNSSEFEYSDFKHYGLAMDIYTHFTSPIRRYCDVLAHRLLAAAIDVAPLPLEMTNKQKLNKICDNMNKQNRKAFFCSRESNAYSVFIYFSKYSNQTMDVVINHIDNRFISGISQDHGIETNLYFENNKSIVKVDEENKTALLKNNECIKLFSVVKVLIKLEMINYRREIKFIYTNLIKQ